MILVQLRCAAEELLYVADVGDAEGAVDAALNEWQEAYGGISQWMGALFADAEDRLAITAYHIIPGAFVDTEHPIYEDTFCPREEWC